MGVSGEPDKGTEDMSSRRKLVYGGSFLDRLTAQDNPAGVEDLWYCVKNSGDLVQDSFNLTICFFLLVCPRCRCSQIRYILTLWMWTGVEQAIDIPLG